MVNPAESSAPTERVRAVAARAAAGVMTMMLGLSMREHVRRESEVSVSFRSAGGRGVAGELSLSGTITRSAFAGAVDLPLVSQAEVGIDASRMLAAVPGVAEGSAGELATMLGHALRLHRLAAMVAATQAGVFSRALRLTTSPHTSSSAVEMAVRSVAAEFGAALRLSDAQVQRQFSDAYTLVERFPQTHAALSHGVITAAHARVVVQAGAVIAEDGARADYERSALARARATTPWRLRGMLASLAEEAMPVTLEERHREARRARCITLRDECDGMSTLSVLLPTLLAHGAFDRITTMARTMKNGPDDRSPHAGLGLAAGMEGDAGHGGGSGAVSGDSVSVSGESASVSRDSGSVSGESASASGDPGAEDEGASASTGPRRGARASAAAGDDGAASGPAPRSARGDTRTLPQIAVDVLCDLLLGAAPVASSDAVAAIRGRVQLTVPVTTLAGQSNSGATLTGVGPIDASSARLLAAHQPGWDRILTDAASGTTLSVDRYIPTSAMRRFLATRDEHCRFPGCRRPVHRCDLDHTLAWEHGGRTTVDNLAHLCRRHHMLKHNSAWMVENLGGGTLKWTSPLGYEYIDSPPRRAVTFRPTSTPRSAAETPSPF